MEERAESRQVWPFWRVLFCALLPWLVGGMVAIARGPLWACVGFGIVVWAVVLVGAIVSEAIRDRFHA